MAYFELLRWGYYSAPDCWNVVPEPELNRELIRLITYGLNG
jgi:hypothetical protein